jgi:hypothetical protein
MSDYLKRLIYDLVFYRRASMAETEWFLDKGHNDFLVPQIDLRIEEIIDSFEKYHRITYDTQGLRDHGIDVLLRYRTDVSDDERARYIGFQIKSYNDLEEKGWLTKLKAQIFEAENHVDLEDFYVIICTDARRHIDKFRYINAEVSKDENIYVVRPEFSLTFLRLTPQRISAYLKARLSQEDEVFKVAFDSLSELTPHQGAIIIELVIAQLLEGKTEWIVEDLQQQGFIQSIYTDLPNLPIEYYFSRSNKDNGPQEIFFPAKNTIETWDLDLEKLEQGFVERETKTGIIKLRLDGVKAIASIILDGHVRYGYEDFDLRRYIMLTLMENKMVASRSYSVVD